MDVKALRAFLALPPLAGVSFSHEHNALHVSSVRDAETLYRCLGYEILRHVDGSRAFFAQRLNDRLEIMDREWAPEHAALAVGRREDFDATLGALRVTGDDFEIVESKENDPAFGQVLFRHRGTGAVLQVVWRKEPLFRNVFGEGFAPHDNVTTGE